MCTDVLHCQSGITCTYVVHSLSGGSGDGVGFCKELLLHVYMLLHATGNRQDHTSPPVCCCAGLPCGDSRHVPGGCAASDSTVTACVCRVGPCCSLLSSCVGFMISSVAIVWTQMTLHTVRIFNPSTNSSCIPPSSNTLFHFPLPPSPPIFP